MKIISHLLDNCEHVGEATFRLCDWIGETVTTTASTAVVVSAILTPPSWASSLSGLSDQLSMVELLHAMETGTRLQDNATAAQPVPRPRSQPVPTTKPKTKSKVQPPNALEVARYKQVKRIVHKTFPKRAQHWERKYLMFTGRAESRFNHKAKSFTGAAGVWQFTRKTANEYGLNDPHNTRAAAVAAVKLAQKNKRVLQRAGIKTTPLNCYRAHMVGAYGLTIVVKAANDERLSLKEREVFTGAVGVNMSARLLDKYFLNWRHKPVKRAQYTYGQIARDYLALFETREREYLKDIQVLERHANRTNTANATPSTESPR